MTNQLIPISMLLLGLLVCAVLIELDKFVSSRRERISNLTKEEREAYVERLMADKITNMLEDMEYREKITREEKEKWYKRLAYNGGGLFAKEITPQSLVLPENATAAETALARLRRIVHS